MKRLISTLLTVMMVFTLATPAFAIEASNDRFTTISNAFGIPTDALYTLDSATINSLYIDAVNNTLISSNDTYVKVETTEAGDMIMYEATYNQYLQETSSRISKTDESSGWMRFHTTVFEVDSRTGQASCAFTWLTPPSPRMKDVIDVSLRQGTVNYDTANGFYTHSSPNDNYSYTFKARDMEETGAGVTANFKLRLSDYVYDTHDYAFLRFNFTKEGTSEGVNGTYAHQKLSIAFNPSFSIDRYGVISASGGFSIVNYYVQEKGYVSINW